ncbi:AAA family ATPase [Hansschlegelia plantiphila]|uniref:Pilus assembly protein n=1 Tax=Hansschlegelia plantiphila TaxID=374655 RepID=A0A9W6IZF7_9HYPH|nr:CpaE family protein [Hansschlegelia plantiphila]GLK66608.1 pilus assembly protein [Hansschlegelia plantiphila]
MIRNIDDQQSGFAGRAETAASQTAVVIASLPRVSIQAFCETPEIARLVEQSTVDRRMEKAHVKVQMGGGPAATEAYKNAPTPNVIVIEGDAHRERLLETLQKLSDVCDNDTKVVVIGQVNDVLLYRELMRLGVSDYLVPPFGVVDLVRSLSEIFRAPGADPVGRTIAFVGAKGGVGSSTIAHNASWAMARQLKLDSVVVDLDLAYGTAGLNFNQDPPQGIAEVVFAPERLDAALVDRMLSKCTEQLSLLAAPATLDRVYDFHEDVFDPLLEILRSNVPCSVLDVPHVWTAWSKRALIAADEVVVVASPDLANLRNAKNLIDLLKAARPNDSEPRLILNQVGVPKRSEIKPGDFAQALDLEAAAIIPFEPGVFGTAANNGQMIAETAPSNKINEIFVDLAKKLTGKNETKRAKRTLLEPLMARLNRKKAG